MIAILNEPKNQRKKDFSTYKHKAWGPSLYFSQTDSSICLISSSYTQTHKHTSAFCSITFKWSWNWSLGNFARHKHFDWNAWENMQFEPFPPPSYEPFLLGNVHLYTLLSRLPPPPHLISSEHISGTKLFPHRFNASASTEVGSFPPNGCARLSPEQKQEGRCGSSTSWTPAGNLHLMPAASPSSDLGAKVSISFILHNKLNSNDLKTDQISALYLINQLLLCLMKLLS